MELSKSTALLAEKALGEMGERILKKKRKALIARDSIRVDKYSEQIQNIVNAQVELIQYKGE